MTRILLAVVLAALLQACRISEQQPAGPQMPIAFKIGERTPTPGYERAMPPGAANPVFLPEEAILTNEHFKSLLAKATPEGPCILFTLSVEGAEILSEQTKNNLGKPMAVFIDGELLNAPIIRDRIGTRGQIRGDFTLEEAEHLADAIMGRSPAR